MNKTKGKKIKKIKKFPPTPTPVKDIGKWRVAIDERYKRIYFWDEKQPMINFYYDWLK